MSEEGSVPQDLVDAVNAAVVESRGPFAAARDAVRQVKNAAGDVVSSTIEIASDVLSLVPSDNTVQLLGDLATNGARATGNALGTAGDVMGSVGRGVGDAAGAAGDALGAVSEALGTAGEAVGDVLGAVAEGVGDVLGGL